MDNDSERESIISVIAQIAGRVIIITLLVFAAYIAVSFSFGFGYSIFAAESVEEEPGTDVEFTVDDGESVDDLAERLYAEGIIPGALAFKVQARLYDINIYPGTYALNTSMSTKEVVKALDLTEEEYQDILSSSAASENDGNVIGGGDEGPDDAADAAEDAAAGNGADGADADGDGDNAGGDASSDGGNDGGAVEVIGGGDEGE